MKSSTQLAISFGTIFGSIALVLSLAFARFAFRKHRKGRAVPVDPVYEAGLNEGSAPKEKKRWFGGSYGLTPIAERGPGGTKQYLSGWFALDAPMNAGWTTINDDGDSHDAQQEPKTWRESHFSRASRAFKRSKSKKGPRPSRTTELMELERDKAEENGAKERSMAESEGKRLVNEK